MAQLDVYKTMSTKIVGYQSGHDVAYCILEDGIPVIHEELERITRKKMEYGDGLKLFFERNSDHEDIKYFTFGNPGVISSSHYRDVCKDQKSQAEMQRIIAKNQGDFFEFGHHLSHGANAFYTSDFDKALIVAVDGFGEEEGCVPATLTIDEGIGTRIKRIRIFGPDIVSLGEIYNLSTKWVFGLSVGIPNGDQAGTVMAMSTLGEPKYTNLFADFKANRPELIRLAKLSEQEKFNVAASLQQYTEKTFHFYLNKYIKGSAHENLCFSGGVSLNCVMLAKARNWWPQIKNVFCDPVPYDAGLALGSARYLWHHVLGNPRIKNNPQNMSPYLGKIYSQKDIEETITKYQTLITVKSVTDEEILAKIAAQKIVSVFGGGSESGRRALGNRSILADPRNAAMKEVINDKIKHRQWFRPLAPAILQEKVGEWFEDPLLSPYMSFALKFKDDQKSNVPAVVHYDGTGRLQTVNKASNPWFHGFLQKWTTLTGVPILINTSFNDREPIVETPTDAIRCFLGTGIDYLYFFDYGIGIAKI